MQEWQAPKSTDYEQIKALESTLNLSPIILKILVNRGFNTASKIEAFMNLGIDQLTSPDKFHDLDRAVTRIESALDNEEKITIYGDYDADGVTSVAVLVDAFMTLGIEVDYYVPSRFTDGYGPNMARYQELVANGTKLLITVDNGITGIEEVAYAQAHGVDVIVTDHHDLPPKLPEAYAIVHPRHPDSQCEFGYFSGAGVAFYLAWGLLGDFPLELTDLVAIGTVADVMPLVKDNRLLVATGLKLMQKQPRVGLTALAEKAKIDLTQITTRTIGFGIAPRLNSLGRLDSGRPAVELLTTIDSAVATQIAEQVETTNNQRRTLVQTVYQSAVETITDEKPLALVVAGIDWPEGVLGIVASRLVDAYQCPTIVLSINSESNEAKGSGRSVGSFNLFDAIDGFRDNLIKFGGHAGAVGLSITATKIDELRAHLIAQSSSQQTRIKATASRQIDYQVNPQDIDEITPDLVDELDHILGPVGEGNPEPVFDFSQIQSLSWQAIGKTGATLKGQITPAIEALGFRKGELAPDLQRNRGQLVIIGTLAINEWQHQRKTQLNLLEISIRSQPKKTIAPVKAVGRTTNNPDLNWHWQNKTFPIYDLRRRAFTPQLLRNSWNYICFSSQLAAKLQASNNQVQLITQPNQLSDFDRPAMFVDLPSQSSQLTDYLSQLQAVPLYLLFYTSTTRQEQLRLQVPQLRQLLKEIYLQKSIGHAQYQEFAQHCQLSPSQFQLGIQVFSELNFVKIDKKQLLANRHAPKRELIESHTFRQQQRLQQSYRQLAVGNLQQVEAYLKTSQHG